MGQTDSYLTFELEGQTPSGKTSIWTVTNGDHYLGQIKWHGPWRCYTFHPAPQTLYEKTCLRDIATFCETATQTHKRSQP